MNRNDRWIVGLVMTGHALVHTFELSIPILVTIWLAYFDTSAAVIGLVVTVGYALFGIGALPGGILTDAVGSRLLIASCLLGMGGSFVLLALAPSIWGVTLALFVWGVAASVYHPAGLRLISTGVQERGLGFAYHGMAGNVGIAFGPLLTAVLLIVFDWRTAVSVLAVLALLAGVASLRISMDETAAVDSVEMADGGRVERPTMAELFSASRALFAGAFAVVFLMVMFSGTFYRGVLTFMPEVVREFPRFDPIAVGTHTLEPANYFYVGLLVVGIAGQYVGGRLTDRYRTERGLAAGFVVLTAIALVFVPAADWGMAAFLFIGALLGFFLFMVQPLYQATVAEYSPAEARGLSYGFTYLGIFGVGAAGGALAGFVLTFAAADTLFYVLAIFTAVPALLAMYLVATQ